MKHTDDHSKLTGSTTYTTNTFNIDVDYGHGGFVFYLPGSNMKQAMKIVDEMKEYGYIDKQTRAMAFSILYYNKHANLFSTIRIVFEFFGTDYIEKTAFIQTFELLTDLSTSQSVIRNGLIIVIALFTIYFLYQEYINVRTQRWKYITFWNAIVVTQFILIIVYISMFIAYSVRSVKTKDDLYECYNTGNNQNCFVDIFDTFIFFNHYNNVAAFVSFITFIKVYILLIIDYCFYKYE